MTQGEEFINDIREGLRGKVAREGEVEICTFTKPAVLDQLKHTNYRPKKINRAKKVQTPIKTASILYEPPNPKKQKKRH